MEVPRITELPATLASQIAAGEVIERPAAVVKELLDNSIDSGANNIDIDIVDGGHKRISVSDDGHGIHPDDIELALRRHSTSKLSTQSDLDCITSLGFRGEALASIAAVSKFLLTSRVAQSESAWSLSIDPISGSSTLKPAARSGGTTIEAANIFQSTPARRKFMRSQRTEFLQIVEVVKRVACSRFNITFKLSHNNKIVSRYRACQADLSERVVDVFGKQFLSKSLTVNYESEGMKLWGWLGGGDLSRSQSDRQFCFVNGRVVRDKKIFHAVRSAFGDTLPTGRYPSYLLHLELDPAVTDINVHPTKSEIRFKNTRNVHDFINASLRDALKAAGTLDLTVDNELPGELPGSAPAIHAARPVQNRYLQVKEPGLFYQHITHKKKQDDLLTNNAGLGAPVAALGNRIVLAQREHEYVLLNFQAATEYILKHRLKKDYLNKAIRHRPLLVPVEIEANPAQVELVEKYSGELEEIGISLRIISAGAIVIKAIPALLEDADVKSLARSVLTGLENLRVNENPGSELLESMTKNRRVSVDALSSARMQSLLNDLDRTDLDTTQKHHKGLWRTISVDEISKLIDS